ncbi:MAG: response regulator [Pseudomonadota bacterium]
MLQTALPIKDPTADIVAEGLRILILDDSDFDLRRVSRMISEIRSNVFIKATKTLEEFEEAFKTDVYSLCLIDHSLGNGKTSSDAMDIIKSSVLSSETPAVLITGMSDDTILIEAVRHGFVSYLDKAQMTVAGLKTVITEALDEVALTQSTAAERADMVNTVMDEVAQLYSANTKQHLSKIYQTANFLRQCIAQGEMPSPDAVDDVEASCFAIWRFLDEAEHHGLNFGRQPN